MTSLTQITVPFHSAELYLVEHNGQPYVPMRSIVQGMGLDWKSQFVKLKQRFSTCVVEITMQILGDDQARLHTCLLLRKLPAWLYSIHANKVKPELRETVIMYQNECDDVLWDYWTKGQAINQRKAISPEQQDALHAIVDQRAGDSRKIRSEMWTRHNRHFKIAKYSQLLAVHFHEAVHYLETMDIKSKPEAKNEYAQLPIKPQVLTIASNISNSWVKTQHQNWFVQADNHGNISIMSLPFGYYPFNVAEFTKHFDGVLNTLYGADILSVGRYFLKEMK